MIIVAGQLHVVPGASERFVALSRPAIEAARAHPACRDFVVAPDPLDADRVNVCEVWDALEPLLAFRADGPSAELAGLIVRSAVREFTASPLKLA